jgi:hypothetical protein
MKEVKTILDIKKQVLELSLEKLENMIESGFTLEQISESTGFGVDFFLIS